MAKLLATNKTPDQGSPDYLFYCDGCKMHHGIWLSGIYKWNWNGSIDTPTITPSILIRHGKAEICHSFITNGKIQYLNDCTHTLAGQTIELQNIE